MIRAAALLLLLALPLSGCRWFFTGGDRAMISAARDQLRRAGLKADGTPALEHVVEADKDLAAMDERHGRSTVEWPEADDAAREAQTEKRGAYKATTEWWARLTGALGGVLGLLLGNPWTAALGALAPALAAAALWLKRRLANSDKAGLDAFDSLATETGATKEQKARAGQPLARAYRTLRKATP